MNSGDTSLKSKIAKFFLTMTVILGADFFINFITKYVISFSDKFDPHIVTLMGMSIALVLFYLVFINLNKISGRFVSMFVQLGRIYFGRWFGLVLSILILLYVIYAGYYWVWFDKNFFVESQIFIKQLFNQLAGLKT